jgi:hypothetical protein
MVFQALRGNLKYYGSKWAGASVKLITFVSYPCWYCRYSYTLDGLTSLGEVGSDLSSAACFGPNAKSPFGSEPERWRLVGDPLGELLIHRVAFFGASESAHQRTAASNRGYAGVRSDYAGWREPRQFSQPLLSRAPQTVFLSAACV